MKFGNLVEICFLLNLAVKGLKGHFTDQKVRVPYPFWVEPPRIGPHRDYPWGYIRS